MNRAANEKLAPSPIPNDANEIEIWLSNYPAGRTTFEISAKHQKVPFRWVKDVPGGSVLSTMRPDGTIFDEHRFDYSGIQRHRASHQGNGVHLNRCSQDRLSSQTSQDERSGVDSRPHQYRADCASITSMVRTIAAVRIGRNSLFSGPLKQIDRLVADPKDICSILHL